MASSSDRKIVLRSSDGEAFEVDEAVAVQMETIRPMVEKDSDDKDIPLFTVTGGTLAKVIEYCRHATDNGDAAAAAAWNADFFNAGHNTLFDLILAANYLDIKGLLDRATCKVAALIKGKSPEEMHAIFNIRHSTPEEDEAIRRETQWAFE